MSFLATIGSAIADKLIPKVIDSISSEIEKHIPALTAALVTAVTEAAAKFAVDGVDKVTDIIPGQLDDEILDPIVQRAMDIFRGFKL